MYAPTRGPVPEVVAFTIRVDSTSSPELAAFLYNLPYGIRSSVVAELLTLGLAAKQSGASAPEVVASKVSRRRARKAATVVITPVTAEQPPLQSPASRSPTIVSDAQMPARAQLHPILSAPASSVQPVASMPAAPESQPPAVESNPATEDDSSSSAVSQLLGQFDD